MSPRRRRPPETVRPERDPERDSFLAAPEALPDVWGDWGPFEGEEEARVYWRAHGERLTAEYRRETPGHRPWAWWRWDAPGGYGRHEPRRTVAVVDGEVVAPETLNLAACGELTDAEARQAPVEAVKALLT